jgi:hypothetical protein
MLTTWWPLKNTFKCGSRATPAKAMVRNAPPAGTLARLKSTVHVPSTLWAKYQSVCGVLEPIVYVVLAGGTDHTPSVALGPYMRPVA